MNREGDLCKAPLLRTNLGWKHTENKVNDPSLVSGHAPGTPLIYHRLAPPACPPQRTVAGTRTICYLFLSYSASMQNLQKPLLLSTWNSLAGNQCFCWYLKDFSMREEFKGCWGSGGRREQSHRFGTCASVYNITLLKCSVSQLNSEWASWY